MPPAKPIQLGPNFFPKRGDARAYLKEMLNRYDVGDKVSSSDEAVLRALVALHPKAQSKIGCGIQDFSVRSPPEFGGKCFWLNRIDATSEDFSYIDCISGSTKREPV